MNKDQKLIELKKIFSDVINYESSDPLEPIDPLTYKTPEGDSCLHLACIRGDIKAVEMLLELGVNINSEGDLGKTPLYYAKKFNHEEIIDILNDKGAI